MSGFVPEAGDTVSSPREGVTEKGSEGLSPELEERHPRRDRSAPRGGGRVKSGGGESGQLGVGLALRRRRRRKRPG